MITEKEKYLKYISDTKLLIKNKYPVFLNKTCLRKFEAAEIARLLTNSGYRYSRSVSGCELWETKTP